MPRIRGSKFTEDEIKRITSDYSTPIGKGGFGEVFKGYLDDYGHYPVAIKKYIRGDLIEQFMQEVHIQSKINHPNVVKVRGYCEHKDKLIMVTEYISNGNLDEALHNSNNSISLDSRMGIAIGCGQALSYMHSMHLLSDSLICHGDIKPANILLDENLTPKISDFGLSRLLRGGITQYTENVKGSLNYMDPIYMREGRLSSKNDVYSFGVVLMDLFPEIKRHCNTEVLLELRILTSECLELKMEKRPRMKDVTDRLVMLWHALRREEGNTGFWRSTSSVSFACSTLCLLPAVLKEIGHTRIFTRVELNAITQNYSHLLGPWWPGMAYKGTLEDNTLVIVRKSFRLSKHHKDALTNEAMILSQIFHKNIIQMVGCCLEDEMPILVYENASKRDLFGLLHGSNEDFRLKFRLNIAVRTAEALSYLHSSASGAAIRHGSVKTYAILVDDRFVPKLSRFLSSEMFATKLCDADDIHGFGAVLMELISRKRNGSGDPLITEFKEAYNRKDDSRRVMLFDKVFTAQEDRFVLDKIGRLALQCTSENPQARPTMKKVAELLKKLRQYWKKQQQLRSVN